jgi:hypothetical protein
VCVWRPGKIGGYDCGVVFSMAIRKCPWRLIDRQILILRDTRKRDAVIAAATAVGKQLVRSLCSNEVGWGLRCFIIIYFSFARGGCPRSILRFGRDCVSKHTVFRCFARHLFCVTWQGFRERE